MGDKITGRCNCGQHEYVVPRPTDMNICHCIDCREWSGATHSAHLFVKTEDIDTSSPEAKQYMQKGESGNKMTRAWCDKCGSGIWMRSATKTDMTFMKAGLFGRGDVPDPTKENWLKNMEPWETPAKGTKKTAQRGV